MMLMVDQHGRPEVQRGCSEAEVLVCDSQSVF